MPALRGLLEADAVIALTDAGLRVGARERIHNGTIGAGRVIRIDPQAGSTVRPGRAVDLTLSRGPRPTPVATPRPVTVPDVRGLSEADAIIALSDARLEIGARRRRENPDIPAGAALRTVPAAGERVAAGTFVDLIVSAGPAASPTPSPQPSPSPEPTAEPSPEPSGSPQPWPYPTDGVGVVSGTLLYRDATEPTPERVVVLTLLEESADGTRVVPIEQFVDPGTAPQGFLLTFDWADIEPTAAYRVLASVEDGGSSWSTQQGTPVITDSAPVSGLLVPLFPRGDLLEGEVTGVIVGIDQDLSPAATREAFLVRDDTGDVVAYAAGPVSTDARSQVVSIPFLLADIDPDVPHLIVARVVDGPLTWTGPGVPVVTLGAPFTVVVPVSPLAGPERALDAPDP